MRSLPHGIVSIGLGWILVVVLDQGAIFDDFRVWPLQRLLTHVVLGGLLVGSLVLVAPTLAVLAAVVLYAHVLMSIFPAATAPNA